MKPEKVKINTAICIGAKKAGTTWLYQCLREHPDVSVGAQKEPHYFSHRFDPARFEKYLDILCNREARICYESSVSYLAHPEAAQRIRKYLPDAKLLVILRNPVTRAFSEYNHLVSKGRIAKDTPIETVVKDHPEIIENGLYYKHLERFFEQSPKEQIRILRYEDIEKDPQAFIDNVCACLGIGTFVPTILHMRYHSAHARSNPLYFAIIKIYKKLKKQAWGRKLIALFRSLGIRGSAFDRFMTRTTKRGAKMTLADKKFLEDHFKEDTKKLSELLGKNLW